VAWEDFLNRTKKATTLHGCVVKTRRYFRTWGWQLQFLNTYKKIGEYITSTIHINKSLELGVAAAPNMVHLVPSLVIF
jgi:hypothetical protein